MEILEMKNTITKVNKTIQIKLDELNSRIENSEERTSEHADS